ncbi:MAG: ABC transporter permease [Acidobacteria bacterium]|nr:ABC transporter permease [Acidobacteriota bacterium]
MELKTSLRALGRNPGFAALAIGILAMGIGANTALFGVIHGVLLRPLPYAQPERIVDISTLWTSSGRLGTVSGPDFLDWRNRSQAFEAMAAYSGGEGSAVVGSTGYYAEISTVTSGFAGVFGVQPAQGRWFSADEERVGGPPVAVVSHEFAQRAFEGRVLGASVSVSSRPATVVGVMPPGFRFPGKTDIWTPHNEPLETASRTAHNWAVVGRLKPGMALTQAQSQITGIAQQLAREYPKDNSRKLAAVTLLQERMVGDTRSTLLMLFGAVGLVMLIACANVANLLLARASARTREMAVRSALGASRWRLIRQTLVECAALAAPAALLGLTFAYGALQALAFVVPPDFPRLDEVRLDPVAVAFTVMLALLSTLIFGLLPAFRSAQVDVNEALKQTGGRGTTRARLPGLLVVTEVALATMLTLGAGLLIRSFAGLLNTDLGFRPEKLLLVEARLPYEPEAPGAIRHVRFYQESLQQMAQVPGIASAAGVYGVPGRGRHSNGSYATGGGVPDFSRMDSSRQALFTVVTPAFFETIGVALLSGRDFSGADSYDAPFTAIVNQSLARQAFPNQNPLGQQILCGLDSPKWMTIVGVVGDTRSRGPASPPMPELYMPAGQHPLPAQWMNLMARTAAAPAGVEQSVRTLLAARDPQMPVKFSSIETVIADNERVSAPRFRTVILGAMAALALVLAVAGVYGLLAYMVSRRTAEFGVRMALGASRSDIVRLILAQGGTLVLAGLALGVAGALAAGRVLRTMVFQVTTTDPLTYAGVVIILGGAAVLASLIPALRASRVDPSVALRSE